MGGNKRGPDDVLRVVLIIIILLIIEGGRERCMYTNHASGHQGSPVENFLRPQDFTISSPLRFLAAAWLEAMTMLRLKATWTTYFRSHMCVTLSTKRRFDVISATFIFSVRRGSRVNVYVVVKHTFSLSWLTR